ncbi:MAG: ABC transporter ATP-binding protein [Phycisphaeraceae bacterium]|nr:ABC transporter ATP-binding protein [Phycisphaeraceae bacterium]
MMSENAISIKDLCFSYGRKQVLDQVNLDVARGSVFGFLGCNGAGKTTTIQLLLGLFKARSGQCLVGGHDPQADPMTVRQTVGYMAEDQTMYGWMRVDQIVQWSSAFYPTWDADHTADLVKQFDLPMKARVKTLSKGQNTRLALLLALAHKPSIVILDDPTLGLDPIARKAFLRHVITLLQAEGVTVFFSSHLLYEIEPVADTIAILDRGRIIKAGPTDQLREDIRRFIVTPKAGSDLGKLDNVLDVTQQDGQCLVTCEGVDDQTRKTIQGMADREVQECALNLDEIFEAYVIGNHGQEVAPC